MPIKLFMDDVRDPPDDTWTVARTVEEAKSHLLGGDVEHASFDHDMGDPPCNACAGVCRKPCRHPCHEGTDGTALMDWMVKNNVWPRYRPKVHSANIVASDHMRWMIQKYGPYNDAGEKV